MIFPFTILFIAAIGYFIIFPLTKKRPVLIKRLGLSIFVLVLIGTISSYTSFQAGYIIALLVSIALYFLGPWVVYGITTDKITDALNRATTMTRTPMANDGKNSYTLDANARLEIVKISGDTHILKFSHFHSSKKAKLAQELFRKFILNYFMG